MVMIKFVKSGFLVGIEAVLWLIPIGFAIGGAILAHSFFGPRGWGQGFSGAGFLGFLVGAITSFIINILSCDRFLKIQRKLMKKTYMGLLSLVAVAGFSACTTFSNVGDMLGIVEHTYEATIWVNGEPQTRAHK